MTEKFIDDKAFDMGHPSEPIGRSNPYYRCARCKPEWASLPKSSWSGLSGTYWLALKDGSVELGTYSWTQGHHPQGFDTQGAGRISVQDVTHAMPFKAPAHPRLLEGQ